MPLMMNIEQRRGYYHVNCELQYHYFVQTLLEDPLYLIKYYYICAYNHTCPRVKIKGLGSHLECLEMTLSFAIVFCVNLE